MDNVGGLMARASSEGHSTTTEPYQLVFLFPLAACVVLSDYCIATPSRSCVQEEEALQSELYASYTGSSSKTF